MKTITLSGITYEIAPDSYGGDLWLFSPEQDIVIENGYAYLREYAHRELGDNASRSQVLDFIEEYIVEFIRSSEIKIVTKFV